MLTGHNFETAAKINQATVLLFIAVPIIGIIVGMRFFYKIMQRAGMTLSKDKLVVDENLPNFFKAVKLQDAEWMAYENMNLRENYHFQYI